MILKTYFLFQIWSALDNHMYLEAAQLYLLSDHIVNTTININASQLKRGSQRDIFVRKFFNFFLQQLTFFSTIIKTIFFIFVVMTFYINHFILITSIKASFPILHHQWAAISHFRPSILKVTKIEKNI